MKQFKRCIVFILVVSFFLMIPSLILAKEKNKSVVATEVEKILNTLGAKGGIGEEVREIAQQKKDIEEKVEKQFAKIESRKSFIKKIIGTDQSAVNDIKKQAQANQVIIKKLEQLGTKTTDQTNREQIEQVVQSLTQQNAVIEQKILEENKNAGIVGWFKKLFGR